MPDLPAARFGAPVDPASLAVVLIHGRGRSPEDIIGTAERLALPQFAYRAPPAPDGSWYPQGFMASAEANQPHLDQSLARIDREVKALLTAGMSRERIALMGFSQGACLASEYLYRNPGRWAGLIAFTGGLIGPEGTVWDRSRRLEGTPVLLSSGDADAWVPCSRMEETARAFEAMGGAVTLKIHPGADHLVRDDEIGLARELLRKAQ